MKVSWQFNWEKSLQGLPHHFLLEVSRGPYSQDYSPFLEVPLPWDVSAISSSVTSKSPLTSPAFFLAGNQAMMLQAILSSLEPSSTYGLRIVPYFSQGGRGRPSSAFQITTLAITFNYWEPVLGRRLSLSTLGGGWSYPVLQRPHLDPEVEIYTSEVSSNPLRYSDSPTRLAPSLPAGRQGESLTWGNNGQVYMFGGRTDGKYILNSPCLLHHLRGSYDNQEFHLLISIISISNLFHDVECRIYLCFRVQRSIKLRDSSIRSRCLSLYSLAS